MTSTAEANLSTYAGQTGDSSTSNIKYIGDLSSTPSSMTNVGGVEFYGNNREANFSGYNVYVFGNDAGITDSVTARNTLKGRLKLYNEARNIPYSNPIPPLPPGSITSGSVTASMTGLYMGTQVTRFFVVFNQWYDISTTTPTLKSIGDLGSGDRIYIAITAVDAHVDSVNESEPSAVLEVIR